ncbi:MAG: hypothetical protein WCF90_08170 [Methanomicrobiales archaeon]
MIDSQMTQTVRDVDIITSEFIRVNETSAPHLFASRCDENLTGDLLNNTPPRTFPPRYGMPNTGILQAAPRPRLPYLIPPKYDSFISISPKRVNEVSLSVITIDCLNKSKRS